MDGYITIFLSVMIILCAAVVDEQAITIKNDNNSMASEVI